MDPVDRGKAGMSTRRTNPVKLPSNPAATVFVQNLDYSVTWQKLKDVLKVAGRIVNVDLARDRDGKSKGHATVQFSEPSEAINAIALFHGQMLCDRPMKLRMDSSSPYQPDPIQLRLSGGSPYQPNPMQMRLSGLAGGATPTLPVPPPPPPPPMPPQQILPPAALAASLGEATPTNPLNVPLLTSVITSLAAEKLAAMLLQNGALGSSGAPGLLQQQLFTPPPLPHLPLPQMPTSRYRAERFSHSSGSRGSPAELSPRPLTGAGQESATLSGITKIEFVKSTSPQNCKVIVRNLNFATTWQHLRDLFRTAGPVRHVAIFRNSSGKSKGSGVVIFFDPESALKAISLFSDHLVDGRKISVSLDQADT